MAKRCGKDTYPWAQKIEGKFTPTSKGGPRWKYRKISPKEFVGSNGRNGKEEFVHFLGSKL